MRWIHRDKIRTNLVLLIAMVVGASIVVSGLAWRIGPPQWTGPSVYAIRRAALNFHTGAASAQIEIAGGPILYADHANQERPIASTTKMMTAYLVLRDPKLPLGQVVTISAQDVSNYQRGLRKGDSEVALRLGQKVTVKELLWALLLPSADDAAWALARVTSGHARSFVDSMNRQAVRLGMHHTHYLDPDGVNFHAYSSAADLLKLCTVALQNPAFRELVGTRIQSTASFGVQRNLNQLLTSYPGAYGVKTGWTPSAGSCLVFAARRTVAGHGLVLYGVVLGEPGFRRMFRDVTALLNIGFTLPYQTLIPSNTVVGRIPTSGIGRGHWIPLSIQHGLGSFQTGGVVRVERCWKPLGSTWAPGAVMGRARLLYQNPKRTGPWVKIVANQGVTRPWWAMW